MADIKAQLKAKNGDNLYPVTSLAYVSAVSSGGIVISGNSIYTSAIPQANVYRLTTSLGAKQAKCSAGFRTEINGATVSQKRYFDIESLVSGGTVTVSAGCAYRILANTAAGVTLVSEPVANTQFGLEGHATIIMTNSSYLHLGSNVVLGQPLITDAANNCTLRFHDGHCIIDVEDHEAAHAVTVATGTGTGSLYYWANWANTTSASATPAYISFSDALDGTACSFNGVTVNGDKHFVGNGKTLTVVTGTATASSKTYLTNMAISGATITGGTVYATDCLIPSGATTVMASRLIASNTFTVNGTLYWSAGSVANNASIIGSGIINLQGKMHLEYPAYISGCTITNGYATYGGAFWPRVNYTCDFISCTITGNTATNFGGGVILSTNNKYTTFTNCVFSGNSTISGYNGGGIGANMNAQYTVVSCSVVYNSCGYRGGGVYHTDSATAVFSACDISHNSCTNRGAGFYASGNSYCSADLVSCTISGNTTASGAGIYVEGTGVHVNLVSCNIFSNYATTQGGVLVNSNGTQYIDMSACTISDNVGALPIAIRNGTAHLTSCIITGNTSPGDVGAGCYATAAGTTVYIDDCLISGNYCGGTANGGTLYNSVQAVMYVTGTTITGNSAAYTGGTLAGINSATQVYSNCILDGNITIRESAGSYIRFGGSNKFTGTTSGYSVAKTITVSSGAILDFTGNTNSVILNAATITFQPGGATVYPSAGSASAYAIGGVNLSMLRNDNIIDMGGGRRNPSHTTALLSGCTFTNGNTSVSDGYYFLCVQCNVTIDNCSFQALPNLWQAYVYLSGSNTVARISNSQIINLTCYQVSNCILSNNNISLLNVHNTGTITIDTYLHTVRTTAVSGTLIINSGTSISLGGNAPRYVSAAAIKVSGGCTLINSAGTAMAIPAGTYTIMDDNGAR